MSWSQRHFKKWVVENESSQADIISAVDQFFDQQDPSTATPMEEVWELCGKMNLIKNS